MGEGSGEGETAKEKKLHAINDIHGVKIHSIITPETKSNAARITQGKCAITHASG